MDLELISCTQLQCKATRDPVTLQKPLGSVGKNLLSVLAHGKTSTLQHHDLHSEKLVHSLKTDAAVLDFATSSSGRSCICLTQNNSLLLYPDVARNGFKDSQTIITGLPGNVPLTCCALADNEYLVTAGTEALNKPPSGDEDEEDNEEDIPISHVLFYDIRATAKNPLLGSYSECHSDAVNNLSFGSAEKSSSLLSGGADGLINMFDLTQQDEDDALLFSFNAEASIRSCKFMDLGLGTFGERVSVVCGVTDDSTVRIWNADSGDDVFHLSKPTGSVGPLSDCQLVGTFNVSDYLCLLFTNGYVACTESGRLSDGPKIGRKMLRDAQPLLPDLSDDIRSMSWIPALDLLVTGCEDGTMAMHQILAKTDGGGKMKQKRRKRASC